MGANEKIQIGIIGAGNIGNEHIKDFKQVDEVQVAGITDVYLTAAEDRAKEHDIPHIYESAEKMIQDSRIDAVVIAVPNKFHSPLAVQALQEGKHVVLEKPMAINAEAAKKIVRAQREAKQTLIVPHQMRWEPFALQAKKLLDEDAFGKVYHAKTGWFRRKGIPGWGTWFTQAEVSGGGALIDIGVHMLDLSLYLMGNPQPVSVSAATYAEFGPEKRGIGTWGTPNWDGNFNVDDLACAFIKMDNGSTLSLDVSWAINGSVEQNGPFLHLFGSKAGATIRGSDEGKVFKEVDGELQDIELEKPEGQENARLQMTRHFVDCVQNAKQPISNEMTGLANNLVLEAIYESSRTGREVKLDWNI